MLGDGLQWAVNKIAVEIVMNATEIIMPECKFCGSKDLVKNGKRNGVQYYICRACSRGSTGTKTLPRMRYSVDIVADGVYDYYAGVSLNKIREGIDQKVGLKPTDSTIYNWVKRLTRIGLAEAKKHTPQVGNKWLADETVIRLKDGKKYWLINVIDYDTRFVLASKLSSSRNTKDIATAFAKARLNAGKVSPKVIMTDGWRAYENAIDLISPYTKHIVTTPFTEKELSTNIVERWHGTLKDRLKPMRGMDKSETYQLILEGFILYYNYLRPHESLNGKTPAEVAGINFPYKSWLDIIKSKRPKPQPKSRQTLTLEEMKNPYKPYRTYKKNKPKKRRKILEKPQSAIMTTRRF